MFLFTAIGVSNSLRLSDTNFREFLVQGLHVRAHVSVSWFYGGAVLIRIAYGYGLDVDGYVDDDFRLDQNGGHFSEYLLVEGECAF